MDLLTDEHTWYVNMTSILHRFYRSECSVARHRPSDDPITYAYNDDFCPPGDGYYPLTITDDGVETIKILKETP